MSDPTLDALRERLTARVAPAFVDGVLVVDPCDCAVTRKPCQYHAGREDAVDDMLDALVQVQWSEHHDGFLYRIAATERGVIMSDPTQRSCAVGADRTEPNNPGGETS